MDVRQLHCPNCGSPLDIVDGMESVTCAYCSTQLAVHRTENSFMLEIGDTISEAIADSGDRTQDAIQQSAYVTRDELRRMQATQQYSNLRLILTNIRSEIRELERNDFSLKRNADIRQLRTQEAGLQAEMLELRRFLEPEKVDVEEAATPPTSSSSTDVGSLVKWVLLWPFLIAAIFWRYGAIGKVGAILWALTIWPLYVSLPMSVCAAVAGS